MKALKDLKNYQNEYRKDRFGKSLLELIPELNPYVHHRLYIAESLGIIPHNMYNVSDIIDDAIILLFEGDLGAFESSYDLKIKLFTLVKNHLDDIFKKESWHKDVVSTDKLLHEELNKLKEKFTYNADEDLVMNEELNDISYHQGDFRKTLHLYDDAAQSVVSAFELKSLDNPQKAVFEKLYNFLSLEASNVVDLHVFGKLSSSEIAQIKGVSEPVVRNIILQVKHQIANLLASNNTQEI